MHPVLISLGVLHLPTYGVAVAAGYLTAIFWLKSQAKWMGFDEDRFWRFIYCIFFGAIAGGKLLNKTSGKSFPIEPLPKARQAIIDAGGLIPYTRRLLKARA